ncbi:hypothetical protein GXM_02476 [Nostoc sphaeroides CCNUC1]|uniref:Uncharacterized protein n=1 Tax=Nostoc sphaeroides CCNUC1 TaxID=2653204 RepID=A0A5P8VXE8_9NOSO|nr:hypothetical protein GXM_02476 [Nostoc sphaeroides CCNUC1]
MSGYGNVHWCQLNVKASLKQAFTFKSRFQSPTGNADQLRLCRKS